MSMRMRLSAAVGVMAAAALVVATGTTAWAAPADAPEMATVVAGTVDVRVPPREAVPVVDSEIGRGARLSSETGATVALGDRAAGAASALVRVAVLSSPADVTVLRSGGVPALDVRAGTSASTTLLLPVRDGAVQLWATAPVSVRIEVLATFAAPAGLPGEMVALDEPVLRADTAEALAASVIGTAEVPIGVVGKGGVPSTDVRAVHATLVVTAERATTISAGGQSLPVAAGRTTLTTILAPGADGAVRVSADAPAQLQVFVIGWVPDAPPAATQENLPGSFVVTDDTDDGGRVRVTGSAPVPLPIARNTDAVYSLGLLSAAAASETTLLDLGPAYSGRARGAVVDAAAGALPQLVLTPASDTDVLTLRRGEATVMWAPVGDILGEEHDRPFAPAPSIAIDSHDDGADVDLGDHGYFTLSGTLDTPAASVDRVEVSGPEGLIGTADVRTDENGTTWEFGAAAPEDGSFVYTATVFDRAGRAASDDVRIDVVAVDADDPAVTSPDVYVYNEDPGRQELHPVAGDEVRLDVEPRFGPGDILVAAVGPATPDGLLVRVTAIDRVGDAWRVHVEPASLDEAIFQADVDESRPLDDVEAMAASDEAAEVAVPRDENGLPLEVPDVEYLDGEGERAWIVPAEQVDLEEVPDSGGGEGAFEPASFATAAAPSGLNASLGMQVNLLLKYQGENLGTPTITEMSKAAATPAESRRILESRYREVVDEGVAAIALSAEGQVGAELRFVFQAHVTWRWGFVPTGVVVDEITLELVTTYKVSASLKFSVSTQVSRTTWNAIGGFALPTLTFPIGPVPVIITNDVGMGLKFTYGLEGALSLPAFSYTRESTSGFTYTADQGYRSLSKPPSTSSGWGVFESLDGVDLSASANVGYGPEISFASKLYGAAGPELTLGGQVRMELSAGVEHDEGHWRGYIGYKLVLGIEFAGKVKLALSIFGRSWELGEATLARLSLDYPLFQGRWTTDDLQERAVIPHVDGPVKNPAGHGASSDV